MAAGASRYQLSTLRTPAGIGVDRLRAVIERETNSTSQKEPSSNDHEKSKNENGGLHMQKLIRRRLRLASRLVVTGLVASAVSAATVSSQAAGVLDGQTIRVLAIGDAAFHVIQKLHGHMAMAA